MHRCITGAQTLVYTTNTDMNIHSNLELSIFAFGEHDPAGNRGDLGFLGFLGFGAIIYTSHENELAITTSPI